MVELSAKIASGYHSDAADKQAAAELMQLGAIRHQCSRIYDLVKAGKSQFFELDESKLPVAVAATEKEIRERYPSLKVPPHSRLRHFEDAQLKELQSSWKCDKVEAARRMVDLIMVSVLLDAGAGPHWQYVAPAGKVMKSSEGLAQASLSLFQDGFFSTDTALRTRVNSAALKNITEESLARGLQSSKANPLLGVANRAKLLRDLGVALETSPEFFGKEVARPGHLVDYLLTKAETGSNSVGLEHLWRVCLQGLASIWPLQPNGTRGDIWKHQALYVKGKQGSDLVPFHKLTQWLVYSLMDVLDETLGLKVTGLTALTGLPEYRNGGLLVDCGIIKLKDSSFAAGEVNVGTELVVEWRALTVVLLDRLAESLRQKLQLSAEALPLAAVLEGGTWHAGRRIAQAKRSDGSAPIRIRLR